MKKILPYVPGIILFLVFLAIGLGTGHHYGISWDEQDQRRIGMLAYDYVFNGKKDLLSYDFRQYGTGFELPMVWLEKIMKVTDSRDIYIMRHQATHVVFLLSAFAFYLMSLRLTRNSIIAAVAMLLFLLCPRIYAHSFFNTKDIPFLCFFVMSLSVCTLAFEKDKLPFYILLGCVAGYTTSIRVMGILLFVFIAAMLVADVLAANKDAELRKKKLMSAGGFAIAYFLSLYIAWPYLWLNPVANFMESYELMSHYKWTGIVLLKGTFEKATELPSNYFPTWFAITVPVLWMAAGIAGAVLLGIDFVKKPKAFFANGVQRNFLFFAACLVAPIVAVIKLHSVIYDDWRHLYFVYPSFVLMAVYLMYRFYNNKTRFIIGGAVAVQAAMLVAFMVNNHPFQQVYFNELVSHEPEYLRANYELDFWGPSFMNALQQIAEKDKSAKIKLTGDPISPLEYNLKMLDKRDRERFELVEFKDAKYFVTNFRFHPEDYPNNANASKDIEYNIMVCNSSIMRVYNLKKENGK